MAQEFSWGKTAGAAALGALVVLGVGAWAGVYSDAPLDLSGYAKKEDVAKVLNATADLQAGQDALTAELLAEDVWESSAEVLALTELEDRDYKELGRFVLNDSSATRDDVDELGLSVEVKDVSYSGMDHDDQNGVVELELRVRWEDASGDRTKATVTATVTIEDGEVEDVAYA